jgi:hypothetical protein
VKWPGEKQRQKLWSEGAQTEGVVVKRWWHSQLQGTYGIEFRVKFPDGSTADVKERFLDASNQGYVSEGDVVPVRYDTSDFSNVRLDVPALEAPLKQARAAVGGRVDAALERLGEPGTDGTVENPGSSSNLASGLPEQPVSNPEDRLAKLADLKDRGVLSDEEFAAEKGKILGEPDRP